MNWRRATQLVVLLVVIAVVLYDVAAFWGGGVDATVSRVVLGWAHQWPVVPFGAGVVSGHLFWPQPQRPANHEAL